MNIEEIIVNAIRKIVRKELERSRINITTSLPNKLDDSIYGDIEWLMELKKVERETVYSWAQQKNSIL